MKNITIIGAGFAAISAIRHIRKRDQQCTLTVIAPSDRFVYAPSLIWIPTKKKTAQDITVSLANFFRRHRVELVTGRVASIADDARTVVTEDGREVRNDALIIASGARFIKKAPGIEHALTICEGIAPTEEMARRIDTMEGGTIAFGFAGNPLEKAALRGGPMFELMFGVDTYLRQTGRRDRFTLKFFSPAEKPGIRLGERAYQGIIDEAGRRQIEIASLGAKIVSFEADKVTTEKCSFHADLTLFMPGLTGQAWFQNTPLPLSEGGLIRTDAHTRVEGLPMTYAIGDSASYQAPDWAPKQAHMADLQGKAAAINCLADLRGEPSAQGFRWELLCIIDTVNSGILVLRTERFRLVLKCRLFHWLKMRFEQFYLKGLA